MSSGNYKSAAACYEKIIKAGPDDITHHVVSKWFHIVLFLNGRIIS